MKQSSVSDWVGGAEPPHSPEGRKSGTGTKKVRKRGKLTKAEMIKMKASHVDIGTLLGKKDQSSQQEEQSIQHEDQSSEDLEPEKEIPELESEQRMAGWKAKKQRWETWKFCKLIILSVIENLLESVEPEMSLTCTTRSGWKSSQGGSAGEVNDGSVDEEVQHKEDYNGREEGVITLTGSVEVATPQSNIVIQKDGPGSTATKASLKVTVQKARQMQYR